MKFHAVLLAFTLSCVAGGSLQAQERSARVDRSQIDTISAADRSKIEEILRSNRLISPSQKLTAADDLERFIKLPEIRIPDPRKELCKIACDVSALSAIAACSGLSGGVAITVCTAAAVVARDACKNGC